MALPVYPSTLPWEPDQPGWGISSMHQDPLTDEAEDGPEIMRRRSTGTWTEITESITMDGTQLNTWRVFTRDTLQHGARRFTKKMLAPWTPAGTPERTVYMKGGRSSVRNKGHDRFVVSFTLMVLDY